MRIAIFSNTYWPTVNGVAISIANLRRGLLERGHEVTIFAPAPAGFDVGEDEPGIIRFAAVAAPVEADYQLAMPYSRAVVQALRRGAYDLVHTQHPMWVGTWGHWYGRLARVPVVTTIHTQYEIYSRLLPLPTSLVDAYLRLQVTSYCNRCDCVTTPAASARERLLGRGVKVPVEVIYNPTDLSGCMAARGDAVRARFGGAEPGALLTGYVGRLSPEKNLTALVEAAGVYLTRFPQAQLVMVGDGPARPGLEAQAAALPVGDRIRFVGKVPHSEVPEYQAALDLFVTPSMMEVQPLSFAEAFAAGAPIAAFNVSGNNDMIEDGITGRLVAPDAGAAGLAAAVGEMLGNPDQLARMSAQARERSRRYDLPVVVDQMLECYARATDRARTLGRVAPR